MDVPNLRFPEFCGEWSPCRIKDFGLVVTGNTPPTKDTDNYIDGTMLWASPTDLGKEKYVYDTITKLTVKGFDKTRKLPKGSILVTCIGSTIGKMGMSSVEMSTNQQINSIIVNPNMDNDFVYHAIERAFPRYLSEVGTQAVPILSKSNFENLPNHFTNKEEQNKIGKLFNLLEERISTQKKIIEDLKQLRVAIRSLLFKNINLNHSDYTEIGAVLDYEHPDLYIVRETEYSTDKNKIPVLTANKSFILGYTYESFGVYNKGNCIIFDDFTMDVKYIDFPFKVKSSAIKILTAKDGTDLYFMYEYLQYLHLISEEHKRHYISEVADIALPQVPIKQQERVAKILKAISHKIEVYERIADSYIRQKQYLLQQMFI